MQHDDLIMRNVRPMGKALADVAIRDGHIRAVGQRLSAKGPEIDGGGQAIVPGLIDHHIHLFATAARRESVDVSGCVDEAAIVTVLRQRATSLPLGTWIRAIGYDERAAGLPDRHTLDQWLPSHPLRMQDRTGALWLLNSAACEALGGSPYPEGVRMDNQGAPTGHIWREDAWLRSRLPNAPPSLTTLGAELARYGITGVTDAGAHNGPAEASLLTAARASGALPQQLMIMGRADLLPSPQYNIGPLKLHFDERDLPDVADVAARISEARAIGRGVAAHCVTMAELLLYLAALEAAGGALPGDRIEHGSVIPASLIPDVALAQLTVVSQPGFVHERGDRYLTEVDPAEWPDLYRLRSLAEAGVPLAAGSDAPYASFDPWMAMRAAQNRCTANGALLGAAEALDPAAALNLYLGRFENPGGPSRQIAAGAPADLCLLNCGLDQATQEPDAANVRATIIDGTLVYEA